MSWKTIITVALGVAVHATAVSAAAQSIDPAQMEFFEKKIRPVLVESCYKCHSSTSEKVKGGLLLDSKAATLKGGDNGAALVPGNPDKSALILAIRHADEEKAMPPKKRLPAEVVADFETWVKMGAPDPRDGKTLTAAQVETEKAKKHWAFQPVTAPTPPEVKNRKWVRNPVDQFILAKQEAAGLKPSPVADRRTLLRRAAYTLTGLPPTEEEVKAFEKDKSPDALEKVVDRLLTSPRYGERWARHWLDVARYADTKGYVFEEERRYPYSYTYRDYVIRAFNDDLPYDRFLVEQIAADHLELGEDKRPLAAMGFLTLGRRFLNNVPDIIDDRIDVISRGTLGLTVACARCHDHKFDPISAKDYYAFYGVFNSSHEPNEKPLLGKASIPPEFPAYEAERLKRVAELDEFKATKLGEAKAKVRGLIGSYLHVTYQLSLTNNGDKIEKLAREAKLEPSIARRFADKAKEWQTNGDSFFAPWFEFAALAESDFAAKAAGIANQLPENPKINPLLAKAFYPPPASLKDVAEAYNKLFGGIDSQWKEASGKKAKALDDANAEQLRMFLYADGSPANPGDDEVRRTFDTPAQQRVRALQRKVDELDAIHPGAPPRAMALADNSNPGDSRVFKRGNPGTPGDVAPRRFLDVLSTPDSKPFTKGSGRLELAQSIASPKNPLTARVMVNRVWMHHFGKPLVTTPADFGVRTEAPVQRELLDYLAARFMADGWSMKKLHKLILLSATWQQSSDENPKFFAKDPLNNLLWKQNRQRLDFEALRDSFLSAAGRLDITMGGHAVDITVEPFPTRRSVYAYIERQNLPGLFRTFDFASPDVSTPQRFYTTVPQQALFLMNSPFIVDQARALAADAEKASKTPDQQIDLIYERVLQRDPERDERRMARSFLGTTLTEEPFVDVNPWSYGYGEFDGATRVLKNFTPLPKFKDNQWRGGDALPDEKLGWVLLGAEGGHPGKRFAAIRRWTSSFTGEISISGELSRSSDAGDGVRGSVVSSRTGVVLTWQIKNGKVATPVDRLAVTKGETIDFVVDCIENENSDSFGWAPTVRLLGKPSDPAMAVEWSAQAQFLAPAKTRMAPGATQSAKKASKADAGNQAKFRPTPLKPLEQLAQVVLLSNEFSFVD